MKHTILLGILAFVANYYIQGQEKNIAVIYIEKIADLRNQISKKNLEFIIESVHGNNDEMLEEKRKAVTTQIDDALRNLDKMYSHAGDAKLKNESLKILEQYRDAYANDYVQALRLKKNRENSFEDMKKYMEIMEMADKKVLDAENKFERAFDEFVENYKVTFNRNLLLEKTMDIITHVNEYNRKIYLVYFKIIKLSGAFIDAVNAKNINTTKETRQELLKGCDEQLLALEEIGPFKEDDALQKATEKFIKFYKSVANNEFADLEFYIQRQKSLTRKDVDTMRGIISGYGKESRKYHDKFNMENVKLLQTFIPKDVTF